MIQCGGIFIGLSAQDRMFASKPFTADRGVVCCCQKIKTEFSLQTDMAWRCGVACLVKAD